MQILHLPAYENLEARLTASVPVRPRGKPTMTARSKFNQDAYWKFCDELRAAFGRTTQFGSARRIEILAYFKVAKDQPAVLRPHDQKPDASNILKAVEDALLRDDSQIYRVTVEKYWTDHDEVVIHLYDVRF